MIPLILAASFQLTPMQGLSNSSIYRIEEEGKPAAVLKIAKASDEGEFLAQCAAQKLHLEKIHIPAIDKAQINGVFFIVQEFAKGKDLYHQMAPDVFNKLGKGLFEFHQKSTWGCCPLSEKLKALLNSHFESGLPYVLQFGIDPSRLTAYFTSLSKEMAKKRLPVSMVHDDPNFSNFLYDRDTDTLTVIDFGDSARFIDEEGCGTGTPLIDIVKVISHIHSQKGTLPEERIDALLAAFLQGYPNIDLNSPEFRYFFIADTLDHMNWYEQNKERLPLHAQNNVECSHRKNMAIIKNYLKS
jgi:Ser/Thr protein kinase RdoA (MazF antagonist)